MKMTHNKPISPTALLAAITIAGSLLGACKDDPPPPLPAPAPETDVAAQSATASGNASKRKAPRSVDPLTMKIYRIESCYYGAFGLGVARDGYLASTAGGEPGPGKIPSFGEYPENVKKKGDAARSARVPGRAPLVTAVHQLPFLRHLRACNIAVSLKSPAIGELDAAIAEFNEYVKPVNQALLDANRYYARKQYDKDEFKKAKEIHAVLADALPKLDAQLTALAKALDSWRSANEGATPKLVTGEPAKITVRAVEQARQITAMFLADERDAAALDKAIAALDKDREALVTLGADKKTSPHASVVPPRLEQFVAAAKAAAAHKGKLSATQSYPITAAMTLVIDAGHRALTRQLRSMGRKSKRIGPARLVKPRVVAPDAERRVRPK